MVVTRSQAGLNEPVTPEASSDGGENLQQWPASERGWKKSESRISQWVQPFRSLRFEEEGVEAYPQGLEPFGMEMSKTTRDELYTGRHGGISLADFEDKFRAIMAEVELKSEKYTPVFALNQMPRYLGGEALKIFRKHRAAVLERSSSSSLQLSSTKEEGESKLKFKMRNPIEDMFEILKDAFPAASQEKMEEITRFAFKSGESLKAAYLRLEQLMEDTELRNPRDAAEDYLGALPYKARVKVADAVHIAHGRMYTLEQVYEMAERILPADAYSTAYFERRTHGLRATTPGVTSNARDRAGPSTGPNYRRERPANVGMSSEGCSRCLGPHYARECEYRWSGSKGQIPCPTCGRPGHTGSACWKGHPELKPAHLGQTALFGGRVDAVESVSEPVGGEKSIAERRQMLAMIAELQRKLDQALSVNTVPAVSRDDEDYDEAPSYLAVRKKRSAAKTAEEVKGQPEGPDEEDEVSRQLRLFAKMPRSFVQKAGCSTKEPVATGGVLGMSRLNTEVILSRIMDTPCLTLKDVGMASNDLRTTVHRWVTTRGAGKEQAANTASSVHSDLTPRSHQERMKLRGGVAMVKNEERHVEINGFAPERVLVDTGAEPVLLGRKVKEALGLYGNRLDDSPIKLATAAGTKETVLGITKQAIRIVLNPRKEGECEILVRCLVTNADNYDVLLGSDATYWPALGVDPYKELAFYRPDWKKGSYERIATIPLDLHRRAARGELAVHVATKVLAEGKTVWREVKDRLWWCVNAAAELWADASPADDGQEAEACVSIEETPLHKVKDVTYEPEGCLEAGFRSIVPRRGIDTGEIEWKPHSDGIVMMELFAGLSTGLEAILACGIKVKRYFYCDNSWSAQVAARERVKQLQLRYPLLLPPEAVHGFQAALPADVKMIGTAGLKALGSEVDLLVAGWECQGMSNAGRGEGLQDKHSGLFRELMRVLLLLQKQHKPCWYVIENVPACFDRRERLKKDYQEVKSWLGDELLLDAAQFGSYAHRLRSFWTNIAPVQHFQERRRSVVREELDFAAILGAGRRPQEVVKDDKLPFYPANQVGKRRQAWPTFVSAARSYAFKNRGAGSICGGSGEELGEPNAEERELAMGFQKGTTAVAGLDEIARRRLLGQALDLNTLKWIVSTGLAYQQQKQRSNNSGWQSNDATAADCIVEESEAYQAERGNAMGDAAERMKPGRKDLILRATAVKPAFAWDVGGEVSKNEYQQIITKLEKFRHVFAFSVAELGKYDKKKFALNLQTTEPIFRRRHRLSKAEWDLVEEKCQELAAAGLIRKSDSQYAAATVLPSKKDADGNWTERRMCGDYRPLNAVTPQMLYPMPTPDEIFDAIGPAKYFTTLDMRQGFNQIEIEEHDKGKTAFWGRDCLWEWESMPFGMKNASIYFQQIMDAELADLPFTRCYIDDIIVFSNTFEEHMEHLEAVFTRLEKCGLRAHPKKCKWAYQQIEYLGHLITPGGIEPQQAKIAAILQMPKPEDVAALRAFLGLANYYRKFCKDISRICKPLYDLLKKDSTWEWGQEQDAAWEDLKRQLTEHPVLSRPDFDKPFVLYTDWSMVGIGAILAQLDDDGEEHVVAYASRSNNHAESNYSSYEGECLAAVWAVLHFRPYLYGRQFQIVTDHQPLHWLMTNSRLTGKLARWALLLSEYEMQIVHRAGRVHSNADGLSRNPMANAEDETGARQDVGPQHMMPSACLALLAADPGDDPRFTALEESVKDVWADPQAISWLQHGVKPPGCTEKRYQQVKRKTKRYFWKDGQLFLKGKQVDRVVPPPEQRRQLVEKVHDELGHFGVKRTHHMLRPLYFWAGMYRNVEQVVAECSACDRVKARFTAADVVLHSLPIRGLFFRWSLDLMPELPTSRSGNKHCLLMIEHFSKWAEVAVFPTKTSRNTARAFLQCVLSRFGSCAEVLTDQGTEFRGEFQQLLDRSLIDHRRTSRDHPQADGLAERLVQTVKDALRKYCMEVEPKRWDEYLPYILLGYRISVQAALASFSPYYLLLGRNPIMPNVAPDTLTKEVNWAEDKDECLRQLVERGKIFERILPMAMENLAIAQHRDQLRYAFTRGGSWKPKARRFQPGDFVYVQHKPRDTLDVNTSRVVLRVVQISEQAVAELEGEDGRRWKEHVKHLAPCHLPNLDTTLKPSSWRPPPDLPCELCGRIEDADVMLLCDRCNKAFHMFCLTPALDEVPTGDWFCVDCQGLTMSLAV